jgi:hypothetical protein
LQKGPAPTERRPHWREGGSSDNLDKLPWSLCDHLRPLKKFEHQYFFTGGSVNAAAFVVGGQAGVDVVFDIYNMQAAVFGYAKRVTASSNASISAGGYVGYGFGDKGDVITAWSGQFIDDVGSIETPWLNLSESLGYFHAPDNIISGAYLGVGIGTSLLPIPVGYDHTIGVWEAWDAGAIGMAAQSPGSTIGRVTAQPWSGKPAHAFAYVQYPDAFSLAMAIRRAAPGAIGEAAALDAIALALAREAGVTISQLCPASGVAASLPAPPAGGQCAFGTYADVSVALRSCNNQIQPCQSGYNCK